MSIKCLVIHSVHALVWGCSKACALPWDHQRTCEQFLILGFSRGEAGQQLLQPLLLLQGRQRSTLLCISILDSSADRLNDAMHEDTDLKVVSSQYIDAQSLWRVPVDDQAHCSWPRWCVGGL